ncbi:hypothetical protein Adu01nite_12060 [Paractinoplanes durhamensis]|uniref:Uncharacterized protein n=1 Tax=Paractinoplanes durhamensis TaxID=113563 RepID=A0ABQ3YQN0_9ACTN|nr:hypothetical protein Adu01nite_12060 [Actinoplanes durhamensis]
MAVAFGILPPRPRKFFAQAADCGLMIRDGEGYRFLHAEIYDYFRSSGR